MNTFTKSIDKRKKVLTENGGITFNTSKNKGVDLFFTIGALRGQGTTRLYKIFADAFGENPEIATRIMLWARDAREGAGERQIFRDLLNYLETVDVSTLKKIMPKIPLLGRWDDLLVFKSQDLKEIAYGMIRQALYKGEALCAKWLPRKGPIANDLRKFLGMTPKQYRKTLVALTKVVETQMCNNEWSEINYEHVPSLAQARYNKAFLKHDAERYRSFGEKAVKGEAKINTGAVYPYDVLKPLFSNGFYSYAIDTTKADSNIIQAQWDNLPNYMGEKSILPVVDVSGSMWSNCGGNLTCLQVAVSLGLYMATKNKGDWKNLFLTFTSDSHFEKLRGNNIVNQVKQMSSAQWGGSTNIESAFREILKHAVNNNVPAKDMPEYLVIFSDMEFNYASTGKSAYGDFKAQFKAHGYEPPKIVWWNIQSRQDNVPVKFNKEGTALVSGFSPTIAKNILTGKNMTPESMMMEVIMNPRYDF